MNFDFERIWKGGVMAWSN